MKKQALLIGINDYPILSKLKFARLDAEATGASLKQNYCFTDDEVLLLTDAKPGLLKPINRRVLVKHLEKLADQELDLFIFGFWGHGLFRNGQRYFCPMDAIGEDIEELGLSFDVLQNLLINIKAKNTCLILDCCQRVHDRGESETFTAADQTVMENAARDIVLRRKEKEPEFQSNVAILNSCKEGQSAYEWDARQHGLFTAHLLDAMKKRSSSVMQIASYISSSIGKTALELGMEQTPFYKIDGDIQLPVNANALLEPVQPVRNPKPSFNLRNVVVPDNVMTLEEAYDNVQDGGIITIQPGKYELSKTLEINRSVTFRGSSGRPEDVVIYCPSSHAFKITSGSPSFQNLTASSGTETCGGFYITGGTPKLFRCIITSRKGAGMYVYGEKTDPQVESCTIKNCGQAGVFVYDNGLGTFKDCEIYRNENFGIAVQTSGNPTVTECKIHDGKKSGVFVWQNGLGTFSYCEIYGNAHSGIEVRESGNPTVTECKIHDGKQCGVYVWQDGLGTFNDCEIYRNESDGIAVQTSGNPTVTECKIHDGKDAGVYVYDNGLGTFNDCEIYGNAHAGIYVETSGNPTVTECKIHDGKKSGVFVWQNGLGTFSDCEIYRNESDGIAVQTSGNPTVTGCIIHDGKQSGVFVWQNGLGTFNDCEIYGNAYAGIGVKTSGNPTVTECKIHGGKDAGVYVYDNGLGTFNDCEIYGNAHAGIYVETSGNPTVTGCVIRDGKQIGVYIDKQGMGVFNNNTLDRNNLDGRQRDWFIRSDAGYVRGSGNSPSIPSDRV